MQITISSHYSSQNRIKPTQLTHELSSSPPHRQICLPNSILLYSPQIDIIQQSSIPTVWLGIALQGWICIYRRFNVQSPSYRTETVQEGRAASRKLRLCPYSSTKVSPPKQSIYEVCPCIQMEDCSTRSKGSRTWRVVAACRCIYRSLGSISFHLHSPIRSPDCGNPSHVLFIAPDCGNPIHIHFPRRHILFIAPDCGNSSHILFIAPDYWCSREPGVEQLVVGYLGAQIHHCDWGQRTRGSWLAQFGRFGWPQNFLQVGWY